MSDFLVSGFRHDRLREISDWAMFSLGIVSLGIAVGGTVLTKTNLLG